MSQSIAALSALLAAVSEGLAKMAEGTLVIVRALPNSWAALKAFGTAALAKLFALMLTINYLITPYAAPGTADPIRPLDESGVKMTFAALADPQISNYMIKRDRYFRAAGEDLQNAARPIDALMIAGDIVENGLLCEYDRVYELISGCNVKHYIMASGNHDVRLRRYKETVARFTAFTNKLNKNVGSDLQIDALHYTYAVNGYHFIVLGTDRTEFEEAYINDAQLSWLDASLKQFTAEGKPVFVILHQPLKLTHGLPDTWGSPIDAAGSVGAQSDQLYEIMNRYNNVILITGHLHTGIGQYTYETLGKIHAVNLPSTTIQNKDGEYNEHGIGYMVEVYKKKVVFRARNFNEGFYVPEYDFTIDVQ